MCIYVKTFKFLKRKYPNIRKSFVSSETDEYEYSTLLNIPFDIRTGYEDVDDFVDYVYINGRIFYDFRKVKKYINKVIKGNKNGK